MSNANPVSVEYPTDECLDAAVDALRGHTIAVLTGAGVSTDSGIPDYRGAGAPVRAPMTFQNFMADLDYRKRYWAGSHLGWKRFSAARPNPGHAALVELELAGIVDGIITQNVDGLHLRAGSQRVVDLHGTMDRVRCLTCGQFYARQSIADQITAANPWIDTEEAFELSPDGDVEVRDVQAFVLPECSVCGGVLKPDVVFFGEFVPKEKFAEASALMQSQPAGEVLAWIETHPASEGTFQASANTAGEWTNEQTADEVAAWLQAHRDSPVYDGAAAGFAARAHAFDPEGALIWANTIKDENQRQSLLQSWERK